MVKEVVVRSSAAHDADPSRTALLPVSLVIPIALGLAWTQLRPDPASQQDKWTNLWVYVVLLIFLLVQKLVARTTRTATPRAAVVQIYATGVQLTTLPSGKQPVFLSRDSIVDCIVTEHVSSHKVRSLVLFRIRRFSTHKAAAAFNTNNGSSNGVKPALSFKNQQSVQLVQAFPGMEMTYVECLQARRQILDYLKQV